ncbi:uncharacterized protein LOC133517505 [Cydia pomonella]|uniref:uncharacterized protein LOC133517505 n=1 Tax=Cydia pomonella TaxID=82600 RepID=UPI002ADE2AB2|nr:uncharacterized protein LOC133517505 [Cydia pomonella]
MGYTSDLVLRFLRNYFPLKGILLVRAFFGHYFSFKCPKIYLKLHKVYCVVVTLVCVIIIFIMTNEWRKWVIFELVIMTLASILIEGDCCGKFLSFVECTDHSFGLGRRNLASPRLYAAFFIITSIRLYIDYINIHAFFVNPVLYSAFTFLYTGLDLNHLLRMIVFDILYERAKHLRNHFESICSRVNGDDNMISEVKRGILLYKELIGSITVLEKIQVTYLLALVARFAANVADIHLILCVEKRDEV